MWDGRRYGGGVGVQCSERSAARLNLGERSEVYVDAEDPLDLKPVLRAIEWGTGHRSEQVSPLAITVRMVSETGTPRPFALIPANVGSDWIGDAVRAVCSPPGPSAKDVSPWVRAPVAPRTLGVAYGTYEDRARVIGC